MPVPPWPPCRRAAGAALAAATLGAGGAGERVTAAPPVPPCRRPRLGRRCRRSPQRLPAAV
ncbi:hypothetical protein I547_7734 [Mycobacterium kansasii 824]|nr:hypothetical protein I547_7734 [Mycobacterium kansasii 824]